VYPAPLDADMTRLVRIGTISEIDAWLLSLDGAQVRVNCKHP
jgi:hypothetical protein